MLKPDEDRSFFNRERDKLAGEIAAVRAFCLGPSLTHTAACRFISHGPHINNGPFYSPGIRGTLIK